MTDTITITNRSTYDQCVRAINEAVKEFLLDQPEIAETVSEDEVWVDMASSLLTEAAPKVAEEVCRVQIGFVPQPLRHLWVQRERAKRVTDLERQRAKTVERKAARERAELEAEETRRMAERANMCMNCFTVRAPSGACNC
jgi:DNA polymerase elongation subunit (family B)